MENKLAQATESYYLLAKNGGFEVHRITSEEGIVLEDIKIDDPDAWDQAISILERHLSKKFQ